MKQLTIRGFDPALQQHLHKLAQEEGLSLNKAALLLLRRGAGLDSPKHSTNKVGNTLDHLIGAWSQEEEETFLQTLAPLDQIDKTFWS